MLVAGCNFTQKQYEIVKDNLHAFMVNFKDLRIKKADFGPGYYVFVNNESYIQYCYNIHYLNGWLYGCVQAVCRNDLLEKKRTPEEIEKYYLEMEAK